MEFAFAPAGASRSAEIGFVSLCLIPSVRVRRQLSRPRFSQTRGRLLAEVQSTRILHLFGRFSFSRYHSRQDGVEHDRLDFSCSRSIKHYPKPSLDRIIPLFRIWII